jgi:hypothetical protein
MGDIKSTLDLVMERTKHLSLSGEERQAQKSDEARGRINGLIQQCIDRSMACDRFTTEYDRLKQELSLPDDTSVIAEIIQRLNPEEENGLLLNLLEELSVETLSKVKAVLDRSKSKYVAAAAERQKELSEDLKVEYHISGSAVVPNIKADAGWLTATEELYKKFCDELSELQAL